MLQSVDKRHRYGTRAARCGKLALSSGTTVWLDIGPHAVALPIGGAEGHGVDLGLQAELEGGVPGGVWGFCLWGGRVPGLWEGGVQAGGAMVAL